MERKTASVTTRKLSWITILQRDFKANGGAYLLAVPVIAYFILFAYKPLFGAIIAFKDFSRRRGIWGSPWADNFGFEHFIDFFTSVYFERTLRNTLTISLANILFGFPLPIILALLINEIHNKKYKRLVQTVSYMPYFISTVVVCSMITLFTDEKAFVAEIVGWFGMDVTGNLLNYEKAFLPIYTISTIWQSTGWNSIIYLAALSSIDMELYEAARIDGANRWKQTLHVTIPGISSTIILLLILAVGNAMNVGYEKVILLYNDLNRNSADVISSYVYRRGIEQADFSFGTAVGLFNSVINFVFVVTANKISHKVTGAGLW